MMKMKFLSGIVLTSILLISCDDTTDTLGNSLTNNVDQFQIITDTFNVRTRSVVVDSVLSRSQYSYLGHMKDPETGTYVTSNYTTQFAVMESFDEMQILPKKDSIFSRNANGEIIADSCRIQIYFYSSMGDSLNPMRLTAYEMKTPVKENELYYTNFDPEAEGMLRSDNKALKVNKVYTPVDLNLKDSLRGMIVDKTNMETVSIPMNTKYYDVDGNEYENYGTYIMRKYYENPDFFKNSYNFIHNVCPGFYIKSTDGVGVMSEVYLTDLVTYYQYESNDSVYTGSLLLSGTKEVLQTTNIQNDRNRIEQLAADSSCTYLKTPAGIFTEVTLPVDEIKFGHERDTVSSAKIVFNRINADDDVKTPYIAPTKILMIPADSLYSFFEENNLPDNKTSFVGTYSGKYNTYTFNNISTLISMMYENKRNGKATENWNKVVLVPITISYNESSSSSSVTNVSNEMSLRSTRLVGGYRNSRQPIKISVIYNRFTKD